jgi:hypothetical protein
MINPKSKINASISPLTALQRKTNLVQSAHLSELASQAVSRLAMTTATTVQMTTAAAQAVEKATTEAPS